MGIYTPLVLDEWIEKAFYHGLRTNGFVILAGQTGTGKTKLFEEFEVYEAEDEFIWLLKTARIDGDTYWNKIMKFRKWIITKEGNWKLEDYHDRSSSRRENLLEYFLGSNAPLKIFRDFVDGEFAFVWHKLKWRASKKHKSFSLAEHRASAFSRYIDTSSYFNDKKRTYFGSKYYNFLTDDTLNKFFTEFKKNYLNKIAKLIKTNHYKEILFSPNLKEFFSDGVIKVFAFLAAPCRYCEIFDASEIEQIKQNLDPEGKLREKYRELCEIKKLNCDGCTFSAIKKLFFPIRPDFTEPHHLVGYYNPIDGKYYPTELVKFILEAIEKYLKFGVDAWPYLVLFDEMNIAQVEYYFADFLSVLETPRIEEPSREGDKIREFRESLEELERRNLISLEGINLESIEKFKLFTSEGVTLFSLPAEDSSSSGFWEGSPNTSRPKTIKILIPPNLYFVGTVNMDETTRSFSPKVLDRAFVIEFDSNLEEFIRKRYSSHNQSNAERQQSSENSDNNRLIYICKDDFTRYGKFFGIDLEKIQNLLSRASNIKDKLENIHKILKGYGLHFGYRTFEHIIMFILNAKNTYHSDLKIEYEDALDVAIYTKVLPKFFGPRTKLERPLSELLVKLCSIVRKGSNEGNFIYENNQIFWKSSSSLNYSEEENESLQREQERRELVTIESLPDREDANQNIKLGDYQIETKYPLTVKKILEILYQLQTEGFASFL